MDILIRTASELPLAELCSEANDVTYIKQDMKGFSSAGIFIYMLSVGGGVMIVELTRLLIALIKRNDVKSVKVQDTEIIGYSAQEVEQLLLRIHTLKK